MPAVFGQSCPPRSSPRALPGQHWPTEGNTDETSEGSRLDAKNTPQGVIIASEFTRWLPNRHLIFVADSGFAALDLLAAVRGHVCMITRLRLDANLFRPAPKRRPGQRGRSPLKGRALPKLSAVLKNKKTIWTSVVVSQWYNARQRRLLVATGTALWYRAGIAPVPIRWVLVRDPTGEHEPAAFLGT